MFRFPLCLLLIYDLCGVALAGLQMLGPVDLVYHRMEYCETDVHIIDFWINQKKINRTTNVMDITVKNPYPIDDTVTIELKGSMKKEGGYKPGAFYYKDGACKALYKLLGDTFYDILKSSGTEECPLPPGNHNVMNYYFDNEQFTVPQIYGEYKMEVIMYKDDEIQGCFVIYDEFVPKTG